MLFFHLCNSFVIYPNIARAIKRYLLIKSETLSLKTIREYLGFLRKTNVLQWNAWKKIAFLLVANKLIEKIPDPCNANEQYQSINHS